MKAPLAAPGSVLASFEPPRPLEAIRSTIVLSGIAVLRERGLFEGYAARLDPAWTETLLSAIAGQWLPTAAAMAHFGAVDGLDLGSEAAYAIGAASAKRFGATLWGTLVRIATAAGADPWIVLGSYHRMFGRSFRGGGFAVRKLGPKEATIELSSVPVCRYAYFRDALRGAHETLLGFFSSAVVVREEPQSAHADGVTMRASWV